MKRLKKGGVELATTIVIGLGISAIIFVVYILFIKDIGGLGKAGTLHPFSESLLKTCKEYSESGRYEDSDKDDLPDFCDNCPLVNNDRADDKDRDLYVVGCKGNNGAYPVPQPCGDKETSELDNDPKKHPCYKWNGKTPEENKKK